VPALVLACSIGVALAQDGGSAPVPPSEDPPTTPDGAPAIGPEEPPPLVPPAIVEFAAAPYPPGLDRGEVHVPLLLLVNEDGTVGRVEATGGEEPFRSLAIEAAARIRFSPATEGGVPVAVELPLDYSFPAPPVNLRVTVVREGVEGAPGASTVTVDGAVHTTSEEGVLELRNVAPGPHEIRLVDNAFAAPPATIDIGEGERVEVSMTARSIATDESLVGLYRLRRPATIERTITAEQVRTTPGTMGDPIRAVQNLPGVVRTPLDAGWLLVRGGDPEDTGLFIDGMRVPLIYHLGGYTSVLHPRIVEEVTFMPGGYDARYGRATGGAVELETRRIGDQGFQAQVGADIISSGAYVEVPTAKSGGIAVAARRSYLDAVLSALPNVTEEQARIAPRFWDFLFRADEGPVGLLFFGYADEIDAPTGTTDQTVTVTIGTTHVHGRYDFTIGGRSLRLAPFFAHDWRRLVVDSSGLDDIQRTTIGGGRLEMLDDGSGMVGTSGGLDLEGGWFGTLVNDMRVIGHYVSLDPYAALRVGHTTAATAGIRADTLLVEGQILRLAPSPRFDVTHPLTPSTRLVADLGLYHQFPPLDVAMGLPGGPYLPLERSWGGGAGVHTRWRWLDFELDAYAREMSDLTVFEEDGSLGIGQGVAYGIESLTRWNVDRLSGWVSYTWSRSYRREARTSLFEPHKYDEPSYLVIVGAYDLGKAWTAAARWRYASGYVLDVDRSRVYDVLTNTNEDLFPDETGRLPPFHALDVKLSKEFIFRRWSLEAYVDVQNVYNRRVPEPAISGLTETSTVYTYGLFTLPIFGVQGNFGPGHGHASRLEDER
jgi:hypothetical protein